MASVKLTNVKKIYGKKTVAVHDFNLDIADKEFIVFVGPSGCGKSTTLRMIAGLEDISEGTVEIDGKVVNDLQPKDRGIAMVFQNYALYPHLSVFENMAFSLRLKKVPGDEIYKRVTEAAEVLGITEYLTRRPRELSGGQRQRVAIGRAMVRDSKVFLMDEPLSNLDAKLRNQMRAEIILLRKKINTTFIYVTHDQTEAMTLGDRIVIMKDGLIMQVGSPSQVFEMPDNLFVAEFIGAPKMNTVHTNLERVGDEYFVYPFGVKMPVSGEKGASLLEKDVQSQEIVLGVRPEHVTLSNSKNPYAVPCRIRVKEMMGSELHLHVVTGDEQILVIRVPTVDIAPHQLAALVPGVRIFVTFRSKVMHFFNAESEHNLLTDAYSEGEEAKENVELADKAETAEHNETADATENAETAATAEVEPVEAAEPTEKAETVEAAEEAKPAKATKTTKTIGAKKTTGAAKTTNTASSAKSTKSTKMPNSAKITKTNMTEEK